MIVPPLTDATGCRPPYATAHRPRRGRSRSHARGPRARAGRSRDARRPAGPPPRAARRAPGRDLRARGDRRQLGRAAPRARRGRLRRRQRGREPRPPRGDPDPSVGRRRRPPVARVASAARRRLARVRGRWRARPRVAWAALAVGPRRARARSCRRLPVRGDLRGGAAAATGCPWRSRRARQRLRRARDPGGDALAGLAFDLPGDGVVAFAAIGVLAAGALPLVGRLAGPGTAPSGS